MKVPKVKECWVNENFTVIFLTIAPILLTLTYILIIGIVMGKQILFILKKRETNPNSDCDDFNAPYAKNLSTGLYNSVHFIEVMFMEWIRNDLVKVVQVHDNNCIDREVTSFRPDVVVIEALWVVPEKFEILHKLHPHVTWVIRLHSETPFLAQEGIAFEWIRKYAKMPKVVIGANSPRMVKELRNVLKIDVIYLPNYYAGQPVGHSDH